MAKKTTTTPTEDTTAGPDAASFKKAKPVAEKATGTALATWDAELAKEAKAAAAMEANTVGGSKFFSMKSGVLSWNDSPILNNTMIVVVLDSVLENNYYDTEWDPNNPAPPTCYAYGRDETTMGPIEEDVNEMQSPKCEDCKWNEWQSAAKGRGKACRNKRRLAMVAAADQDKTGKFTNYDTPAEFAKGENELGFIILPPTSITAWANYVTELATTLKKPPFAVLTKIRVAPDNKNQFQVSFEMVAEIEEELGEIILARRAEAKAQIEQKYPRFEDMEERAKPEPKGKAKATKYTRGAR